MQRQILDCFDNLILNSHAAGICYVHPAVLNIINYTFKIILKKF